MATRTAEWKDASDSAYRVTATRSDAGIAIDRVVADDGRVVPLDRFAPVEMQEMRRACFPPSHRYIGADSAQFVNGAIGYVSAPIGDRVWFSVDPDGGRGTYMHRANVEQL